ncbi:MAG: hypothetical protein V2A61_06880 [Calditrichota bacterium]
MVKKLIFSLTLWLISIPVWAQTGAPPGIPLESLHLAESIHITIANKPESDFSAFNRTDVKPSTKSGPEFLKSLLIPGWGQLSVGRKKTGYAFLATEAALLSGLIGLRTYANWLEDDYRVYAAQHARVRSDLDHQFYVDVGNWNDRRSYNEQRQRDRDYDRLYWGPDTDWSWDAESNRAHFKSTRLASDYARQQAVLVVGGLLINHLAAAVEVSRGGSKNKGHLTILPQGRSGAVINYCWNLGF